MEKVSNLRPTPDKPMTKLQFQRKWGNMNHIDVCGAIEEGRFTEKHLEDFLNDLYNMYETHGFTERYEFTILDSGYGSEHYGMKYDIIRRETMKEYDDREHPGYLVKFENGDEEIIDAHEIAIVEEHDRFKMLHLDLKSTYQDFGEPEVEPDPYFFRKLYESAMEQIDILNKLLAEKDKEIAAFRKNLKPHQ